MILPSKDSTLSRLFIVSFFLICLFLLCALFGVTHAKVTVQFVGVLSSHHVGPADGTQVVNLSGESLYTLSHLTAPFLA